MSRTKVVAERKNSRGRRLMLLARCGHGSSQPPRLCAGRAPVPYRQKSHGIPRNILQGNGGKVVLLDARRSASGHGQLVMMIMTMMMMAPREYLEAAAALLAAADGCADLMKWMRLPFFVFLAFIFSHVRHAGLRFSLQWPEDSALLHRDTGSEP
jgi:hypothetical protein